MPLPVRSLPVLQNWDCRGCANCCRDYRVYLSEEERDRLAEHTWDEVIGPAVAREGGRYRLNQRADGSCVFLSAEGRCRIHEKLGPEAKPFACRLYPFILVPAGDHWRVGLRYSCPAAAENHGRPLGEHDPELRAYAAELEKQESPAVAPPPLQERQTVSWGDLRHFVETVLAMLRNREDRIERRWRKGLALAELCRQARFDQVKGKRLREFLGLVGSGLDAEVPVDPAEVPPPTWVGRVLFRQASAVYGRKDTGPERGLAARGRLARLGAAWRFAVGRGEVPRVHGLLPAVTFEQLEKPTGPLPDAAEELLERFYAAKVVSLQFCGSAQFGLGFWEGLEALALTLPIVLWLSRMFGELTGEQAVARAIRMVDHNYGYSPLLGSRRQRGSWRILARRGELVKLIAWYSR